MDRSIDLVVAGHICFDVIPAFREGESRLPEEIFRPGTLTRVADAAVSTGGAVSNTGLAAIRLGLETRLMGKVGNDFFGRAILDFLRERNAAEGMIVVEGEASSYTIVLAPPAADRMFLHNPGANDTFRFEDIRFETVGRARLLHFGYPTLMERFHLLEEADLERTMRKARELGTTTSLDMSLPDPHSPAGLAPWPRILERVLPYVDLFLPSAEELLLLLHREEYLRRIRNGLDVLESMSLDEIVGLAEECLRLGASVVLIKCGRRGLYLRTGPAAAVARCGAAAPDPASWAERELWELPYRIERVASATGSGDCCIAGFLAGLLRGQSVEDSLHYAAAAGAFNVTAMDATSGVRSWEETTRRIRDGWPKTAADDDLSAWIRDDASGCLRGPRDRNNA